jgi:hypothetical protein
MKSIFFYFFFLCERQALDEEKEKKNFEFQSLQ